ncbi:MAG: phosphoribosylanthranilate isomerase [Anaerolineae bacterium]
MVQVKICGITRLEDALHAVEAGVDLLGLNFYPPSPRSINVEQAITLCDRLRDELGSACPTLVGVFVNKAQGDISIIIERVGLDFAQLSGDETDAMLTELRGLGFKAIRPINQQMALADVDYFAKTMPLDERAPSLLLDAYHPQLYGGTGESASVEVALAVKACVPRLMLAGGLNPDNIAERVQAIHPWGVDVASGVEDDEPGVKSVEKMRAFIASAKGASSHE